MEEAQTIIAGEELFLLPEKAIYWPKEEVLLISDLHLGKVNHFRRSGIPIPRRANQKNVETLVRLFQQWKPKRVIFLGDLFHSHYNEEWEVFGQVLDYFPETSFELVKGNHDIMSDHQYEKHNLKVHEKTLYIAPFLFSHDELDDIPGESYLLSGHIHPGVIVRGKGRQRLKLPCFYFGKSNGLLPAFGEFTGTAPISLKENDQVFLIVDNRIIRK